MEQKGLVPIDFSEINYNVIKLADEWAQKNNAKLLFLHVSTPPEAMYYPGIESVWDPNLGTEPAVEHMNQKLGDFIVSAHIKSPHQSLLRFGIPYQKIVETQKEENVEMTFMASHEHSLVHRIFLGSTTTWMAHHLEGSLYIYKQSSRKLKSDILVPIDFSPTNHRLLRFADQWAQAHKATLHFIHVFQMPEYMHYPGVEPMMDHASHDERHAQRFRNKLNQFITDAQIQSPYECYLRVGKIYKQIMELQDEINAGLIMMAPHKYSELETWLLGGNTHFLLNHVDCSMYLHKERLE